jgi:transposase
MIYEIKCKIKPQFIVCPICGTKNINLKGSVTRRLRGVPEGTRQVDIICQIPRVECSNCNIIRQVKINFAEENTTYTKKFAKFIIKEISKSSISGVSKNFNVSWDICSSIYKNYLEQKYKKPDIKNLKLIAIDEIAISKGHTYVTIVMNLETKKVIYVGDGKGSDSLADFWSLIGPIRAKKIKAVAIDMSPAYISAVTDNLPKALIVFDHFHVVKLINSHLNNLLKYLLATSSEKERVYLKGLRWLIMKRGDQLSQEQNELDRLNQALECNKPLACGYYMKEDISQIWCQVDKTAADKVLTSWIKAGLAYDNKIINKMLDSIHKYRDGILNWYDYKITTAPLEGLNNKIKVMKRIAYGYRDYELFKLKILDIHDSDVILEGS